MSPEGTIEEAERSAVPYGTKPVFVVESQGLKPWAIFGCPFGTVV